MFYTLFGDWMERQILHIDVNNAFLSWTALELLKEGASEEACLTVAKAIETVQEYSLIGLTKVDYTEIDVY